MANEAKNFQLTADDKERYEKRISEIDLSSKEILLNSIPRKIESLRCLPDLKSLQVELIKDISTLYNLITKTIVIWVFWIRDKNIPSISKFWYMSFWGKIRHWMHL